MVDLLDFEATVVIAHERQGDEDVVVDRWTRPAAGSWSQTLLSEEEAVGFQREDTRGAGLLHHTRKLVHLGHGGPSLASGLSWWAGERLAAGLHDQTDQRPFSGHGTRGGASEVLQCSGG